MTKHWEERLHGFKTIIVVAPIMWGLGAATIYAIIKDPNLLSVALTGWTTLIFGFGAGYGVSKVSGGARDKMRAEADSRAVNAMNQDT